MWYVQLNNQILPQPYQFFDDCFQECLRLQRTMVAVSTNPVFIN